MKPSIRATIDMLDIEGISIETNSQGLWDREFNLRKPEGKIRVAFLGDSVTWGFGVHEQERFTSLIGVIDTRYESMNFGIPGYGTDQALLMYRQIASKYGPDVVVLTVVPNDLFENVSSASYGRPKPFFQVNSKGELVLWNSPLPDWTFWDNGIFIEIGAPYVAYFPQTTVTRSRIARWFVKHSDVVRLVYTILTSRIKWDMLYANAEQHQPSPGLEHEKVRLLTTLVCRLAHEVTQSGAAFLIALAGDDPLYGFLANSFEQKGLNVLDLSTNTLARIMKATPAEIYFKRHPHLRPSSHKAVSDLLLQRFESMKVIGKVNKAIQVH